MAASGFQPFFPPRDRERQRLLAASMRIGMVGMLAAVPLGAFWLSRLVGPAWACFWAFALCASTLFSLPLAHRILRANARNDQAHRAESTYVWKMLLTGSLWGMLALNPQAQELDLLALGILQFLILIVSSACLAMTRFAFPVLALAITLPMIARLSLEPPAALSFAAWGVVCATFVLIVAHSQLFRTLRRVLMRRQQRDALAKEQEALFNAASEGILLLRTDEITKCNWQGAAMLGTQPDDVVGTAFCVWLHEPESWPHYLSDMHASFTLGERFSCVARLAKRNGELFFAELSANPIDHGNFDAGIVLVATDISVRLATEAALRSSEQRFRRLLSLSSDWYWEQDADFRFTQIKGGRLTTSLDPEHSIIGKQRWDLDIVNIDEHRWEAHKATLQAHLPFNDFVYQRRLQNGESRWMSITGHPVYDESGQFYGYHGVGTDITESVQRQERYHHLAHHDTLTGLPNRRLLLDRLDQATAKARRNQHSVAIMMMDLDNFKTINDTDGHSAGDLVLVTVAERLRALIRESDTLSRLGGDEFVVLLPEVNNAESAIEVANKITGILSVPLEVDARKYQLGVSIGIALFPNHTTSHEQLLPLADAAMYQAKQSGGNQHCFAQLNEQAQLAL